MTNMSVIGTRKPPSVIQVPNSTQNKPVALVIDARGAIRADVAGIGNHLGIVATREGDNGGGVGRIVDYFSIRITAQDLIVVPEAFIELDNEAMVCRIGVALDFLNALEVAVGSAGIAGGDDKEARRTGGRCACGGAGIAEISQNRSGSRDADGCRDFAR